jgi:hypothetical protein
MLYEVIVMRSGADTSAEGSTVFRTVVDVDSLDEAAIEGLQAMHREGIAPVPSIYSVRLVNVDFRPA